MNWNDSIRSARRLPTFTVAAVAVNTSYVVGAVGDLTAIAFFLQHTVGRGTIAFQYYSDSTLSFRLSSNTLSVDGAAGGELASYSVPVSGPWLVIEVQPSTAMSFTLQLWSDTIQAFIPDSQSIFPSTFLIFDADSIAYPVGLTVFEGTIISPGPASFFGECTAANTTLALYAVDSLNQRHLLGKHTNGNGANTKLVYLPPMHLQLRIVNGSGAGQFFSYGVTSKYGLM